MTDKFRRCRTLATAAMGAYNLPWFSLEEGDHLWVEYGPPAKITLPQKRDWETTVKNLAWALFMVLNESGQNITNRQVLEYLHTIDNHLPPIEE